MNRKNLREKATTLLAGPLMGLLALSATPVTLMAGGISVQENHTPSQRSRSTESQSRVRPSQDRRQDSRVVTPDSHRHAPPRYESPRHESPRYHPPRYDGPHYHPPARRAYPIYRPPVVIYQRPPRFYSGIRVYRPYGHPYYGYGFYYSDHDAFRWLAFTAITLVLLDQLNENQQRHHEDAQIRATRAPLGESIIWEDGSASGSVTAIREGTSTEGRYCREFRQTVIIGDEEETAYGEACQNPDGTWEMLQ